MADGYPIKLVRDMTPNVINASGEPGELFYARLPLTQDRVMWLQRKLGEEVTEYLLDGGFNELLDVVAVVQALVESHGRTFEYALSQVNRHRRGGFGLAMMMYGRHPEFDGSNDD